MKITLNGYGNASPEESHFITTVISEVWNIADMNKNEEDINNAIDKILDLWPENK